MMSVDAIWENKIMAEAKWYLFMLSTISWHSIALNIMEHVFSWVFKRVLMIILPETYKTHFLLLLRLDREKKLAQF